MQNKTLESEILDAIKKYNIIAYGKDNEIVDTIMLLVKHKAIGRLENWLTDFHEKSNEWNLGYEIGINKAIQVIEDELS